MTAAPIGTAGCRAGLRRRHLRRHRRIGLLAGRGDHDDRISVLSSGTQLDGPSSDAAVSPDGRFVVFSSRADIPGFGEVNDATLWLKDREDGALHRVSFPQVGEDDPGGCE